MSHEHTHRHLLRRSIISVVAALASLATVAVAAPAAHAATLGNVWTVAQAYYNCNSRTVTITPTSGETVNGNYSVWAYAEVYDYNAGRWISETKYSVVDGITHHVFWGITKPYLYAKVHYARYISGAWRYATDLVTIQSDLDNMWCSVGTF